jgi:RNA polymerase sigma factor for flagellar operon FliA
MSLECSASSPNDECAPTLWATYREHRTTENRNAIVMAHTWIVQYVISKLGWGESMFSSGVIGLIDAIERFEPNKGNFHNFAFLRVRGGVRDGAREMDWLSRGARDSIRLYTTSRDHLIQKLHRTPTEAEIYQHVLDSIPPIEQRRIGNTERLPTRISAAINFAASRYEPVEWDTASSTPDHSGRYEQIQEVGDLLGRLDERSRQVVWLHIVEGLTQTEIGEIFGVSGSRISQIYGQAVQTMRS